MWLTASRPHFLSGGSCWGFLRPGHAGDDITTQELHPDCDWCRRGAALPGRPALWKVHQTCHSGAEGQVDPAHSVWHSDISLCIFLSLCTQAFNSEVRQNGVSPGYNSYKILRIMAFSQHWEWALRSLGVSLAVEKMVERQRGTGKYSSNIKWRWVNDLPQFRLNGDNVRGWSHKRYFPIQCLYLCCWSCSLLCPVWWGICSFTFHSAEIIIGCPHYRV